MKRIVDTTKSFLSDPFHRFLVFMLIALALYSWAFSPTTSPVAPQQYGGEDFVIDFFYHPACPHCKEQMPINQQLAEEFKQVKWVYHDTSKQEENQLLFDMMGKLGREAEGVPTTILNETAIVGFDSSKTPTLLRNAILSLNASNIAEAGNETPAKALAISVPFLGTIDPSEYSLPALALTLGFIDGFNPCAMWVLIYLISITLTLHDRTKFLFVVGSFLLASGILYFLIMSAWLNAFLFVGYLRPVMIIVGALAIGWGVLCIKEFIEKKGKIECQVGDLGEKKKLRDEINNLLSAPLTLATMAGIIILAFTVNSIEFVCSSAIPAVFTQVLALKELPALEHYFYIFIYVFMYMLDDIVVFSLAFWAVGGTLGDKIAAYGHAIGAGILIVLGFILLFAPNVLMA